MSRAVAFSLGVTTGALVTVAGAALLAAYRAPWAGRSH